MSNITIVDIGSCLEEIDENDIESREYYERLEKEGKKYVSIDGNNRSTTIKMFLRDEIPLPKGIKLKLSNETDFIIPKDFTLSQLEKIDSALVENMKKKIKVSFNVLKKASRKDLNDSFIRVNEGVSISKQEERNAIDCQISEKIREYGEKYKNLFLKINKMTPNKLDKREHEEVLSTFLYLETIGSYNGVSQGGLSNLFSLNELNEKHYKYLELTMDIMMETISNENQKKISKTDLFNFYSFLHILIKKGYSVKNKKGLYEVFLDMNKTLKNEKDQEGNVSEYKIKMNNLNKDLEIRMDCIENYVENQLNIEQMIKQEILNKKRGQTAKKATTQIIKKTKEEKSYEITNGEEEYGKSKPKEKTKIEDFETFVEKTKLDLSFQRNSIWTAEHQRNYVLSLLKGTTFTDIIVANVEECLKYSRKINDIRSIEYFTKMEEKGYKNVSLDGNNRSTSIYNFLNGILKLKDITLIDDNGNEEYFNVFSYKDLEKKNFKKVKEQIDKIEINTTVMTKLTRNDLNNTFLMLNEGVAVNEQEKRNALGTNMSKFVRTISEKYQYILETKYTKKDNNVIKKEEGVLEEKVWKIRRDDQIISTLIYFELNTNASLINMNNEKLNKMFNEYKEDKTIRKKYNQNNGNNT